MERLRDRLGRSLPLPSLLGCLGLAIAAVLAVAPVAQAEQFHYGCVLTGAQEVGPTGSAAIGCGQFLIDTAANTLSYRITFFGIAGGETAAHIHGYAGPGANAGVVHALPLGNPKVGVWAYPAANEADILAGRTYVNVHSGAFGGGEIRGQIVPLNASLDGAQEVPPVATPATGWGVFTIDLAANMLNYHIAFGGLSGAETAAHIHGTALHGTNAGVLEPLPLGSPKIGAWNYPEAMEADILAGKTYVNVHSVPFGGGEIRGQIVPVVVPMDGGQEVPPNASPGAGVGLIAIDTGMDQLSYDIRYAGLTSAETAAHIHGFAPPGVNAGVLQGLALGPRKLGVWNYGAGNEADVLDGLAYINVHTTMFGGGEIRGQIQGFWEKFPVGVEDAALLRPFRLASGFPNPFRSSTTIEFGIDAEMPIRLAVYDAQGRLVRTLLNGDASPGAHPVLWDGRDDAGREISSGAYRVVLETPRGTAVERVTLLR